MLLPPPPLNLPGLRLMVMGEAPKFLLLPPPPTESVRLTAIPENLCYYPPPTESARLTAIPEILCYYPPPPLNLPGLRRSRKISATTPPPTEFGRPPEITENWPPQKKNPGYAVVWRASTSARFSLARYHFGAFLFGALPLRRVSLWRVSQFCI